MDTLQLPLSFRAGQAKILTDGTDDYYAALLSRLIQIEPGEYPISIYFGTPDPTFNDISRMSLIELASEFIPEINVSNIETTVDLDNSGEETILIFFERAE